MNAESYVRSMAEQHGLTLKVYNVHGERLIIIAGNLLDKPFKGAFQTWLEAKGAMRVFDKAECAYTSLLIDQVMAEQSRVAYDYVSPN